MRPISTQVDSVVQAAENLVQLAWKGFLAFGWRVRQDGASDRSRSHEHLNDAVQLAGNSLVFIPMSQDEMQLSNVAGG